MKALDRSVETLGLWIITSSITITFIKSANQSSVKLCLEVKHVKHAKLRLNRAKVVYSHAHKRLFNK